MKKRKRGARKASKPISLKRASIGDFVPPDSFETVKGLRSSGDFTFSAQWDVSDEELSVQLCSDCSQRIAAAMRGESK